MKHALIFAAITFVSLPVHANPTQVSNGVMASKDGKTLYTFDKDASGKTLPWKLCDRVAAVHCSQPRPCRRRLRSSSATTARPSGLKGSRFTFAGDAKAGDANGDKQGGVWHVIRTETKKTSSAPDVGFSANYRYNWVTSALAEITSAR